MRKKLLLVSLLACLLAFSGCKSIYTQKIVDDINENSNLEIGLLTPSAEVDFSDYGIIPGFGVTGYYDKKYGDYDSDFDKFYECCVWYSVTSYPDAVIGESHVTGIEITDPDISIYGYSVGDSSEEFVDFLEDKGFDRYYDSNTLMKFDKGKVEIRCGIDIETKEINALYVGVDTTNLLGVIY